MTFKAGPGVGVVTRPGLPIPPGEPSINPVPRKMIAEAVCEAAGGTGDFEVEIAVPDGEKMASMAPSGAFPPPCLAMTKTIILGAGKWTSNSLGRTIRAC